MGYWRIGLDSEAPDRLTDETTHAPAGAGPRRRGQGLKTADARAMRSYGPPRSPWRDQEPQCLERLRHRARARARAHFRPGVARPRLAAPSLHQCISRHDLRVAQIVGLVEQGVERECLRRRRRCGDGRKRCPATPGRARRQWCRRGGWRPSAAVPYLASRAFWSASMAGERGAEAMGPPAPVPGGSSSPNAKPSAGASLTPATTAPNSSIVLTPGAASDASAASFAFRSAPILLRRATTEAGAAVPAPARRARQTAARRKLVGDGPGDSVPARNALLAASLWRPPRRPFVSLIDLTAGVRGDAASLRVPVRPDFAEPGENRGGSLSLPWRDKGAKLSRIDRVDRAANRRPGVTSGASLSLTSFSIWRQRATFF